MGRELTDVVRNQPARSLPHDRSSECVSVQRYQMNVLLCVSVLKEGSFLPRGDI